MGLGIKNVGYHIKSNPVKALWSANVRPKSVDADKYVTISENMPDETYNYVNSFKSVIANYAKANKVKLKITSKINLEKINTDVFCIGVTNGNKSGRSAVVVNSLADKSNDGFARKLFKGIEKAINKAKTSA